MIAAASLNNVIGINGQIPWHLPQDLKHFMRTTMGLPCIMGRKTYESIGRALPGRRCYVVSRTLKSLPDAVVVPTLEIAIARAKAHEKEKVFIIGGGELYRDGEVHADTIYLTRVLRRFEGDAFFPELDDRFWRRDNFCGHEGLDTDDQPLRFNIELWKRVRDL